jgi:hypothetical protein
MTHGPYFLVRVNKQYRYDCSRKTPDTNLKKEQTADQQTLQENTENPQIEIKCLQWNRQPTIKSSLSTPMLASRRCSPKPVLNGMHPSTCTDFR